MRSFRNGILWDVDPEADRMDLARDLNLTMNSNIELFLRDKSKAMRINIETAAAAFPAFWAGIGAEGDLAAAVAQLEVRHHQGSSPRTTPREGDLAEPAKRRKVQLGRFRRR